MKKTVKKIDLFNCDCPSFMLAMPTHCNAEENNCNNVWITEMSEEDRTIDAEAAFGQWLDLYMFLSNQGLVTTLPSPIEAQGLGDLVFTANSGIMIHGTFVVSNFTSEPRIPETPVIERFAKTLGCKEVVVCPFKFEGEAEMKKIAVHNGKDVYICGYNMRSDLKAYEWMKEKFDIITIPFKMVSEKCYHLDCSVCPLVWGNDKEKGAVMICEELYTKSELEEVRKYCRIINVPEKLADYGICNNIRCGSFIINSSDLSDLDPTLDGEVYYTERDKNQFLEDICDEFGFEPVFINLSEFTKLGAMASCCAMSLNQCSFEIETV